MKFGMPTLVECADIFECCETAKRHGLDFVEINMSFPQYLPSALSAKELKAITDRDGIFYTIHADEMLNPFDFNTEVSRCYFDVMRKTIRFALEIGAPVINMHLLKGVYVTLPGKVILLTDVYREQYFDRVKEFILMCEEEIGDSDLKIAIENVDSNPFTQSQLEALKFFMASPVFGLTLDTGHELCLGFTDSHVFDEYPGKLVHMHLHDAKGKSAHLPLGTAEVDIESKLERLSTSANCLIEVKTVAGLSESVEYLKSKSIM
jgi:sugar phosphate isomerase/epimerase